MKITKRSLIPLAVASLLLAGGFVYAHVADNNKHSKATQVVQAAEQSNQPAGGITDIAPKAEAAAPAPAPDPVTLRIASINLTAPIVRTGLEADGSLHVPSSPDMTGWYDLGPRPGEVGPSVITGHYDSKAGPGVLYNLKHVKLGDTIEVVRGDGSVAVFVVDKIDTYLQDNFNTAAVYGAISTAGLRVITCSGTYSRASGHYSHDLVVYATLKEIRYPAVYQPL